MALQLNFFSRVLAVVPEAQPLPTDHRTIDSMAAEAPTRVVPI